MQNVALLVSREATRETLFLLQAISYLEVCNLLKNRKFCILLFLSLESLDCSTTYVLALSARGCSQTLILMCKNTCHDLVYLKRFCISSQSVFTIGNLHTICCIGNVSYSSRSKILYCRFIRTFHS